MASTTGGMAQEDPLPSPAEAPILSPTPRKANEPDPEGANPYAKHHVRSRPRSRLLLEVYPMARKGKHGDGVYEDPAGSEVFWARWRGVDGHDHKKKVGSLTRAKAYRLKMVNDVNDRLLFPERYAQVEAPIPPWTMKEAIEDYQANSRASTVSQSFSSDCSHARALVALWGERPLEAIRPVEVRDWMTRRKKDGKKAGTVNREFGFLKRVCRRAVECGRATKDPTAGVRNLRYSPKIPRYLLPEEDARLREHLVGRDWLTVELAYRTGMRREEQFGLRKEQVDLRSRRVTLPAPKSGRPEVVHLNKRAVEILRELMATDSEWVFPGPRGKPRSATFMKLTWLPALERAGIRDFRWHDLRHTFASWLVIAGVDLTRVKELMRHATYEMTLRYAHLMPAHLQDAVEMVGGAPPTGLSQKPNSSAGMEYPEPTSADESQEPHRG